MPKKTSRITSYNVCYTKLLRNRALERYERRHGISLSSIKEADAGFVEFVERELSGAIGAASVITSYSIHYTKLYDGKT